MIEEAIIVLISILVGWFLRDLRVKSIQKKAQEIKKKVFPSKTEVLDWSPPKDENEIAEEKVKKNE